MNHIDTLDSLNLPNLQVFNLSGNQLKFFGDLKGLINLKDLDISKTEMENIDFLLEEGTFPDLISLKCNYNYLKYQYFERLVEIFKFFPNLQEIEFIGNEITLHQQYRFLCLIVEKLTIIDGVPVTQAKRSQLKELKLNDELEELQEKVHQEYLMRIRDEHENKMKHKNLLNERKKFIDSVFDENNEQTNKFY